MDGMLDAEKGKKMYPPLQPPKQTEPCCCDLNVYPTHTNLCVETLIFKVMALGDESFGQ